MTTSWPDELRYFSHQQALESCLFFPLLVYSFASIEMKTYSLIKIFGHADALNIHEIFFSSSSLSLHVVSSSLQRTQCISHLIMPCSANSAPPGFRCHIFYVRHLIQEVGSYLLLRLYGLPSLPHHERK